LRYVRIERTDGGFSLDPTAYVEQLPTLAKSLPTDARSFATDSEHYDFHSQRFVKNLKPQRLTPGNTDEVNWLELQLHCWRHEEDLIIRYHDVRTITVNPPRDDLDVAHLREVFPDEILPHEDGAFTRFHASADPSSSPAQIS
jgi:hypothetical protein